MMYRYSISAYLSSPEPTSNSKFQARNPKQPQILNSSSKTRIERSLFATFRFSFLCHLNLFRASDLLLRICPIVSNFGFRAFSVLLPKSLAPFCFSLLCESFEKRQIKELSRIQVHARQTLVVGNNVFDRFSRDHRKAGGKLRIDPAGFLQLFDGIRSIVFSKKLDDLIFVFFVAVEIHPVRQSAHEVHDGFSVGTNEGARGERPGYGVFKILFREVDEYSVARFAGQQRERRLDNRSLNVSAGQRSPSFSLTADADDHDILVWIQTQTPGGNARDKVRACADL